MNNKRRKTNHHLFIPFLQNDNTVTSSLECKSNCEPLNMIFRKSPGPSNIGSHQQFLRQLRQFLSGLTTVHSCCSTNWPWSRRVESKGGQRFWDPCRSGQLRRTPITWTFPAFLMPIAIIYLLEPIKTLSGFCLIPVFKCIITIKEEAGTRNGSFRLYTEELGCKIKSYDKGSTGPPWMISFAKNCIQGDYNTKPTRYRS